MTQFSIQIKAFKVKSRAQQEMQQFVFTLPPQLSDETALKRFKVSLLQKQIEINHKYPSGKLLNLRFSPICAQGGKYQTLHLKSNFLLIVRQEELDSYHENPPL